MRWSPKIKQDDLLLKMIMVEQVKIQAESFESLQRVAIQCGREKNLATPELDTRLLLAHAAALDEVGLIRQARDAVPASIVDVFNGLMQRRLNGEPVSRILGQRAFFGLDFLLSKDTFDPRADSEVLVTEMIARVKAHIKRHPQKQLKLLDVGTGSGCLLLACLSALPNAIGLGVDISKGAIRQARINATRLGLRERAFFRPSNWFSEVRGKVDFMIANPPYISDMEFSGLSVEVRQHDPYRALVADKNGLACYETILQQAPAYLNADGWIGCEIGSTQSEAVTLLMRKGGLSNIKVYKDLAGLDRVVFGQWQKK